MVACINPIDDDTTNDSIDVTTLPVWSSDSVQADLYLPTFGELESVATAPPAAIAIVLKQTATPEQLSELQGLIVDRSFEYSTVACDIPAGYDVFYLVITDEDRSTRRFSQYSGCGFSRGNGYFQALANGFLENESICNFGMSFGVEGFLCSKW